MSTGTSWHTTDEDGNIIMDEEVFVNEYGYRDHDSLRYKIGKYSDGYMSIVTLDPHDYESGYSCDFVKDRNKKTITFRNYDLAVKKLKSWYSKDKIDPEYLSDPDLVVDLDQSDSDE